MICFFGALLHDRYRTKRRYLFSAVYALIVQRRLHATMKFVLWFMYFLKVNVLQVLLSSSRSKSISLQHIDSELFATPCNGRAESADHLYDFNNNMTGHPVL